MQLSSGTIELSAIDDNPDLPGRESLGERVARGAAWIVAGRLLVRSLGLINTLILARLLTPDDFGVVAIGLTVMQLLQNLSDIGVSHAVVRFREAVRAHYDTLFTLSVIRGVLVSCVLLMLSLFAGDVYNDDRVGRVFLILAIAPILQSLINPRFYEFERDLDFTKEFIASAGHKIVGVIVSVMIALSFKSYTAILLGLLSGFAVQAILSYVLRPFAPRITLEKFRDLFSFTGWLTGVSVLSALNNKLDLLILGRFLGASQTGAFYLGASVAALPSEELAHPIARAIYPGLSELQKMPDRMREAFLRGVEVLGLIAMPATFGCAFVAVDLVVILLGSQWGFATPVVQYLTPAAGITVLFSAVQHYAFARGKPKAVFWRLLIFFCIRMPVFIWATVTYGIMGAIFAIAGSWLVLSGFYMNLYAKISGGSIFDVFYRTRRSFAGVAMMAVYFLAIRSHLAVIDALPLYLGFVSDVVIGAMLYVLTVYGTWQAEGRPEGAETRVASILLTKFASIRGR